MGPQRHVSCVNKQFHIVGQITLADSFFGKARNQAFTQSLMVDAKDGCMLLWQAISQCGCANRTGKHQHWPFLLKQTHSINLV